MSWWGRPFVLGMAALAAAGCLDRPGAPAEGAETGEGETWDPLDGGITMRPDPYRVVQVDYDGHTGAHNCYVTTCFIGSGGPGGGIVTPDTPSENHLYEIEDLAGFRNVSATLTWESGDQPTPELTLGVGGLVGVGQNAARIEMKESVTGPSPLHIDAAFDTWSSGEDGRPIVRVSMPRTGPGADVIFIHSGQPFRVVGTAAGVGAAADAS